MIGNDAGVRIWLASAPVDMRKSFDSLVELVRGFLGHDPLTGSMFVFRNRAGHSLKILWWDRNGLAIYYKRLERGAFRFPVASERSLAIERAELVRLLAGMTLERQRVA
jgi:transposase